MINPIPEGTRQIYHQVARACDFDSILFAQLCESISPQLRTGLINLLKQKSFIYGSQRSKIISKLKKYMMDPLNSSWPFSKYQEEFLSKPFTELDRWRYQNSKNYNPCPTHVSFKDL